MRTLHRRIFPAALVAAATLTATSACAQDGKLTLRQGKMIEIGFLKVKPGNQKRLAEEYFPKAIGVAREYGLKPLMTFRVEHVDHGSADEIGMWGLFEWPSVEKKNAFEKDPRFVKLRAFRDSLLVAPPKLVYTEVAKTVQVQLDPDASYEAAVLWVNRSRARHLDAYFAAAGPFIEDNGVRFIGEFKVIGQPQARAYRFDTLPSAFAFVKWPSPEVKKSWFEGKAFAAAGHHRALALDRLVVVESKANLRK